MCKHMFEHNQPKSKCAETLWKIEVNWETRSPQHSKEKKKKEKGFVTLTHSNLMHLGFLSQCFSPKDGHHFPPPLISNLINLFYLHLLKFWRLITMSFLDILPNDEVCISSITPFDLYKRSISEDDMYLHMLIWSSNCFQCNSEMIKRVFHDGEESRGINLCGTL